MFPESLRNVSRVTDSELADLKRTDRERRGRPEDGPKMFRKSPANRCAARTSVRFKRFSKACGKDFRVAARMAIYVRPKFRWVALYGSGLAADRLILSLYVFSSLC
jgi:hypothetical protein